MSYEEELKKFKDGLGVTDSVYTSIISETGFLKINRRTNIYHALLLQNILELNAILKTNKILRSKKYIYSIAKAVAILETIYFPVNILVSRLLQVRLRKSVIKSRFYLTLRKEGNKI